MVQAMRITPSINTSTAPIASIGPQLTYQITVTNSRNDTVASPIPRTVVTIVWPSIFIDQRGVRSPLLVPERVSPVHESIIVKYLLVVSGAAGSTHVVASCVSSFCRFELSMCVCIEFHIVLSCSRSMLVLTLFVLPLLPLIVESLELYQEIC